MNIIYYSPTDDRKVGIIIRQLKASNRPLGIELHCMPESLGERIRQPMNGIFLVVITIETLSDLDGLIPLKDRLLDLPVIMLMDDLEVSAQKKARSLRPRFIFGMDDDPAEMALVLDKMLSRAGITKEQHCSETQRMAYGISPPD